MKKLARLLALVGLLFGAPAFAQTVPNTLLNYDAKGGFACFIMNTQSPAGAFRRVCVDATVPVGGQNIATGQVSVGTTATLVVAARSGRQRATVNVLAANTCNVGPATVTTTTGYQLQPTAGVSHTMNTGAAVYMVCSATTNVSYIEEY